MSGGRRHRVATNDKRGAIQRRRRSVYTTCEQGIPVLPRSTPAPAINWYGSSVSWRAAVEYGADVEFGPYGVRLDECPTHLLISPSARLSYDFRLEIRGRAAPVPVQINFWQNPPYCLFGQAPQDYPRVFSEVGAVSKHRMLDDGALCLWYPFDSSERRWVARDGLPRLVRIVQDHLFYEHYWRMTGAFDGGTWLGDEAEHGLAQHDALWRAV